VPIRQKPALGVRPNRVSWHSKCKRHHGIRSPDRILPVGDSRADCSLVVQRLERRTHNGNPAIVNIGVPGVWNELTIRGFPPFPIISSPATQKQRKRVSCVYSSFGNLRYPSDFCGVPRFHALFVLTTFHRVSRSQDDSNSRGENPRQPFG
jgi:hypothetical protein